MHEVCLCLRERKRGREEERKRGREEDRDAWYMSGRVGMPSAGLRLPTFHLSHFQFCASYSLLSVESEFRTWNMEHGTWNMEHGTWNMEQFNKQKHGTWNMWNMEHVNVT